MTNEPTLLNFPSQIMDWDRPMSDEQLARQTRIVIAEMLNNAAAGKYKLTEENKDFITWYNETVIRRGYPPLDCDLTQF